MNLYDIFKLPCFSLVTNREGLSKAGEGGFLGHREVKDGEAGPYVWQTFLFSMLVRRRYAECDQIIKAYARALKKHDLLSVTDGTARRTDGTPVASVSSFEG